MLLVSPPQGNIEVSVIVRSTARPTLADALGSLGLQHGVAIEVLRAVYPDVPEVTLVRTLPGLLAGSLAASTGLLLTLLLVPVLYSLASRFTSARSNRTLDTMLDDAQARRFAAGAS